VVGLGAEVAESRMTETSAEKHKSWAIAEKSSQSIFLGVASPGSIACERKLFINIYILLIEKYFYLSYRSLVIEFN
jgi:hypothetical protein